MTAIYRIADEAVRNKKAAKETSEKTFTGKEGSR